LVEAVCLFNSPKTGTTLGLPVSQISARTVREKIAESDAAFEVFQEKACTFVLRQFGQSARKAVVSTALLLVLAGCTFGQPKLRSHFPRNHAIKQQSTQTVRPPKIAGRKVFGKVWGSR